VNAIKNLDQLERALVELDYAAADFSHAAQMSGADRETKDLRALFQNLIALNRSVQEGVKGLRQASSTAKRKGASPATFKRASAPARAIPHAYAPPRPAPPYGPSRPLSVPPHF
jgi:hypothetical protein